MASVISSAVVWSNAGVDGTKRVLFSFLVEDNVSDQTNQYIGPLMMLSSDDEDAERLELESTVLADNSDAEIDHIINGYLNGENPLLIDMGGWYTKAVPLWNTWDNAFLAASTYFWSRIDMLDILPFHLCWVNVSKQDKTGILGLDNQQESDMNADMQIAVDTQAQLDLYSPYFDENGVLV